MNADIPPATTGDIFRILSLDGGGAKGFYTIGVLHELEALIGSPIAGRFNLIYGTSTGAIIAALLALGHTVNEIHSLYKEYVPAIMRKRTAAGRTKALATLSAKVFGSRKFTDVKTDLGIVATRWHFERPMIFKSSIKQAHGRQATFIPGFGLSIAEAVQASCSAYPFFKRPVLTTSSGEKIELIDGGYCANNPSLYAIADGVKSLNHRPEDISANSLQTCRVVAAKVYHFLSGLPSRPDSSVTGQVSVHTFS